MPDAYTLTWKPGDSLAQGNEEPVSVTLESDEVAPGDFWFRWDMALDEVAVEDEDGSAASNYYLPRDVFLATADRLVGEDFGFRRLDDHLRGQEEHSFYGHPGWKLR